MKITVVAFGAIAMLAACATPPKDIAATYVSTGLYENLSCTQLRAEAQAVSSRAASANGQQEKNRSQDAAMTGVGLILFWPALFFMKGDGAAAADVARMKGEMQAIEQVNRIKNCGITFAAGLMRTFRHSFWPQYLDPILGLAHLSVTEIESAGIKEVLQTPGAQMGSWSFLEDLLEPTGDFTPFLFREPLGHAREVKVALSGLFGRFVARAYLERYHSFAHFAHLTSANIVLNARRNINVVRTGAGDLPDWIAADAGLAKLFIAEAKGTHNKYGPWRVAENGYAQTLRVRLEANARPLTVKRFAVATRWYSTPDNQASSVMHVIDPVDEQPSDENETASAAAGIARIHLANLLRPLGYAAVADALLTVNHPDRIKSSITLGTSDREPASRQPSATDVDLDADLLGSYVSQAGPIREALSLQDEETLSRLDLRPKFVGVERKVVEAALEPDPSVLLKVLSSRPSRRVGTNTVSDGSGVWTFDFDRRRSG